MVRSSRRSYRRSGGRMGPVHLLRTTLLLWLFTLITSYDVFTPQKRTALRQLVVDDVTGNIYLGADNYLCQLNPDMELLHSVDLGPVEDSTECIPKTAKLNPNHCLNPYAEMVDTDNIVKILVIDQHQSALIVCGNVYQGSCQMRNLQNIKELINYPTSEGHWVIANKGDNASFGFIAAGPSGTNVFYVGASFAEPDSALVILPSIAVRKIEKSHPEQMFKLWKNSESENKRSMSRSRSRNAHVIYNGGFASGSYRYFSMVKPVTPGSGVYKSRLTRICQSDEGDYRNRKLISYTEAPLECKKEGVNYQLLQALAIGRAGSKLATSLKIISHSDILIALFAQAKEESAEPTGDSAICIYTLKEIEMSFENKTRDCWNGKGYSGLSFDGQNNRPECNPQSKPFNECNVLSNSPLELDTPISKTAAFILRDDIMTSLAVNSHDLYTVSFVGTKRGRLLKLLLESDKEVSVFSNQKISETPVGKMALNKDKDSIVTMTTDTLIKVPVAECETYSNCSSCVSSNNPYCGWCVLKNRCSTQTDCENSEREIHWKRGQPGQCITVTDVSPTSAPANKQETITLVVQAQLPTEQVYECVYDKYGNTPATVNQQDESTAIVKCLTPIVAVADRNIPVELSLKASSNQEPFVTASEPITIYDCTIIQTCQECSNVGVNGCKWCPYDGGCIYQSSTCNTGKAVTSVNVCPTLDYVSDIHIPAETRKSFRVNGRHLPSLLGDSQIDYRCVVNVDGNKQTTRGVLVGNVITCQARAYYYSGTQGVVKAKVTVEFGNVEIDRQREITVDVYKCNQMASDCSQCQGQIEEVYQCSWCTATNQCTLYSDSCQSRLVQDEKTCPAPTVSSINPVSGPVSGGTKVTIEGRNLGVEFLDIESIYFGEVACNQNMYGNMYQVSTRVVCETGYSSNSNKGPVKITVRGMSITSDVFFQYLVPEITGIEPEMGPRSGGSPVTLYGKHLDIGSVAKVEIGTEECKIVDPRKDGSVTCITSRAGGPKRVKIQMEVDKQQIIPGDINYQYLADPTITSMSLECSHLAGGISVKVFGTNLHAVQDITVVVDTDNTETIKSYEPGACSKSADGGYTILCSTPSIALEDNTISGPEAIPIPIAFKLDRNIVLRTILGSESATAATLKYYPDFTVDEWEGGTKTWTWAGNEVGNESSQYYIKIAGTFLTLEQSVSVEVWVGLLECAVTQSSTENEVLCSPPALKDLQEAEEQYTVAQRGEEVPGEEEKEDEDVVVDNNTRKKRDALQAKKKEEEPTTSFKVRVKMGNREQSPGELVYDVKSEEMVGPGTSDVPLPVVLGAVIAMLFLGLTVVILILKYRRNSRRLTEENDVTKQKMHDLESQVARECKDAFTEFQLRNVMNDILPRGELPPLPFLDFSSYAFKVLFPNIQDFHRSSRRLHEAAPNNRVAVTNGLKDFLTLLSSEKFLLEFIYTLEQQPKFNMKDRCNVASLLMVALSGRLDYVTYIMSRLLCNLMKRPQIKTSPHLFLRRTESVAEKFLSNWLTFCLYDHVKAVAGRPLYMLYKAIKATVELGPIDAVTFNARYALSEDRLLRQKVDYKELKVSLQVEGGQMPVLLLDCDTISQAKAKLHDTWYNYKSTPVSQRVPVDNLELRLVGPHQQVLKDEDESSVMEGEWKRINTLKHYQVKDDAIFAFIADAPVTGKYGFGDASSYHSNPKLSRSIDLSSSNPKLARAAGSCCATRPWHLTKKTEHSTIETDPNSFVHVPEIYLNRLLTTKKSLQRFVNELFAAVFSLSNGDVPPAIKFLFDLLDKQAADNGITDPDIIHTWKNNSIPLRFWINIIKNPEMILDVEKNHLIDSILSVIATTYMDSCSLSTHAFSTDSPSSKLLYAKELQDYKPAVKKFYNDIQTLPPVTDEKLYSSFPPTDAMQVNRDAALYDLAVYAHSYVWEIDAALQQNNCDDLGKKFAHVMNYLQLYLIPSNTT